MRYRLLGNSGLRVSELCLGTMTFGEDWGWGATRDESRLIFDAFLEAGGNFIDTANVYTNGSSESLLGEFMAGQRERIVLATKYTNSMPSVDPNRAGNHRKSMVQAVEGSLKRLKTDYIDLYWLHVWDFLTPVEEVMRAFDDLVRAGKILYAGISNAPAWIVAQADTLAALRGWTPFAGLQIEYSLLERTPERDLLPMAQALGIGVTAWSPLANGLLTGKYSRSLGPNPNAGPRRLDNPMSAEFARKGERSEAIVEAVGAIAGQVGRSPAQVALNWLVRHPAGIIPIIGSRHLAQVKDNLACLEFTLSAEQRQRLDEVSRIELGFPHDFYSKNLVKQMVYGGMGDLIEGRARAASAGN
jgi:aryl-alcohol dehydrogenase-like predicted oxidoreductase